MYSGEDDESVDDDADDDDVDVHYDTVSIDDCHHVYF
jgi:hypothetical protein